jgi:hypothetical protein
MRIAVVERLAVVEPDGASRIAVGEELPAPEFVAKPLPLLPIVRRPQEIAGPPGAFRQRGHFEIAVQHHFGVKPSFARVIDLLEEDSVERGRHRVSRFVHFHDNARRLDGMQCERRYR